MLRARELPHQIAASAEPREITAQSVTKSRGTGKLFVCGHIGPYLVASNVEDSLFQFASQLACLGGAQRSAVAYLMPANLHTAAPLPSLTSLHTISPHTVLAVGCSAAL